MVAPLRTGQAQTAAPATVTGPSNSEGTSESFARADHEHRLAVSVEDGGVAVGSRPTVNFTGAGVTVTDDGGNDRIDVDIPGGGGGALAGLPGNIYESLVAYVDPADRNSYPGSGTTVTDIEGALTAGSINGSAEVADGAFRFTDTAGQSVSFTKPAAVDDIFDGGGTVIAFARSRVIGADRVIATTQDNTGNFGWRLRFDTSSAGAYLVRFSIGFTGSNGAWRTFDVLSRTDPTPRNDFAGVPPVRNGSMVSIAVRYDSSASGNDPDLFVEGQIFNSDEGLEEESAPTGSAQTDAANDLLLGIDAAGNERMHGDVGPILFFDRELTDTEICEVINVFSVPRFGSLTGRYGEQNPDVAGQRVVVRAGEVVDGTGAGGTLSLLGGDVIGIGETSDAGDVLLRGGNKIRGSGGAGGSVEIRGGFSEFGQGGALTMQAGESRDNENAPETFLGGGDQTGTGDGGNTQVRAGDATAAGGSNNNGGRLSMRSGAYRTGSGGGTSNPGDVFIRSGGPSVSPAGGGTTGDITIYTSRDNVSGDINEDFAGSGCDTGSILISTEGPGPTANVAGDISVIAGNTTAANGDPGNVLIEAGSNLTTAPTLAGQDGGSVTINAGESSATGGAGSGDGGDVFVNAGDQTGASNDGGRGGDVLVAAGDTSGNEDAGRGGDVELLGGNTGTGGRDGEVRILTPSTSGRSRVRTGGFADSSLDTITVGEQVTLGIGATNDLYQTPGVTNDGDGVKVIAYVDAIDDTTASEVVSTKIEQSFYRSGGTLVPLTAHQNSAQSNGAAWGADGSLSLVVSGDTVIVRLANGSGVTGYTVNVAGYVTLQRLVQS